MSASLKQKWQQAAEAGWLVERLRVFRDGSTCIVGPTRISRVTSKRVYYYASENSPSYMEHWVDRETLAADSIRLEALPSWVDLASLKTQKQPEENLLPHSQDHT